MRLSSLVVAGFLGIAIGYYSFNETLKVSHTLSSISLYRGSCCCQEWLISPYGVRLFVTHGRFDTVQEAASKQRERLEQQQQQQELQEKPWLARRLAQEGASPDAVAASGSTQVDSTARSGNQG